MLDLVGLLTCMVYIDLNPIRAEIAEGLEDSLYTSVRLRLYALRRFVKSRVLRETFSEAEMGELENVIDRELEGEPVESAHGEPVESGDATWLAPIGGDGEGAREPLLGMKPSEYIAIVEAAGRAPAAGKKGRIAACQLSMLQSRVGLHGLRLWQLPLSYHLERVTLAGTVLPGGEWRSSSR